MCHETKQARYDAITEEILAEKEVREVIMRLARGTDRRDRELIRSCYHPDAVDDHGAFKGNRDQFADWVVETLGGMGGAMKPQKTVHFLGQIRIEVEGDVAYTETYCQAHHYWEGGHELPKDWPHGLTDFIMYLRYVDRFEKRDGGRWLIANRLCVWDFVYMVPASHKWDLGDSFTWGRTDRQDQSYR